MDDAINKAQDDYVEIFYTANNSKQYRVGFEVTQQRIDMLSSLVVTDKSITPTFISTGKYSLNLNTVSPKYRHFVNGYIVQDSCRIPITIVRHNDLDNKLRDDNQKPSFKWQRCLGTFKNDGLYLYTDYVITSVVIEYLSNPVKVFSGGYDSLEYIQGDTSAYKSADAIVNSNLPVPYHDLLVDMTVQYLSRVLEDGEKFNLQKEQVLSKI